MPLHFKNYQTSVIECNTGTPGGDTYTVDGKLRCFRFTRSHRRAVWILTGGVSTNVDDIIDDKVDKLLAAGKMGINDDDCVPGQGWMGCMVWDEKGEFIGTVGDRCAHTAGDQTEHIGYGRCRFHGGTLKNKGSGAHQITTGEYSKTFKRLLQEKIDAYAADPNRMDLSRELGVQRAMLDMLLERLEEGLKDEETLALISKISIMAEKVAGVVDKVSSIDHRTALTANQVVLVQATVVDIMRKYLSQDVLHTAAMELSERLGTKAAFGNTMVDMINRSDTVDMPTTRRVAERIIDNG